MPRLPTETVAGAGAQVFATTHWSVVLRAGEDTGDAGARALATLCEGYWYPLYAFVRRLGHAPHDAQDLTQGFFAYLFAKGLLARAEPQQGRFRSFLLGTLKHFLANEWRHHSAQKRSCVHTISFDAHDAEERYAFEPVDQQTPQSLFEYAWAVEVLEHAVELLRGEYLRAGKEAIFQALVPCLQGEAQGYAELGARLQMSEGAVKVAVHRLRQRYRELLRAAVAHTVADPLEVDQELRHLMQALTGC